MGKGQSVRSSEGESTSVVGSVDANIVGAVCYLLGFVSGAVIYLIEDQDDFVRFHAMQSMLTFGGLAILSLLLDTLESLVAAVPGVGAVFEALIELAAALLGPLTVILWLVLMYKAYRGTQWEVPIIGAYARRYI